MKLKAVIVDDEQGALELLNTMLTRYCNNVEVVGMADHKDEAIQLIREKQPDILFMDVEMPFASGFKILDELEHHDFQLIFTTAYDQYAIKAIKHGAVDYLLKPIDIDELIEAVGKIQKRVYTGDSNDKELIDIENQVASNGKKICVPTLNGQRFLLINEISRIEASGSYSKLYLTTGNEAPLITSNNLKEYESLLAEKGFFRIHKSNLINLDHVKEFHRTDGGYVIMSDGSRVEVARTRKSEFLSMMHGN